VAHYRLRPLRSDRVYRLERRRSLLDQLWHWWRHQGY